MPSIMKKLAGPSASSAVVSPHSVFALVAHVFAARTAPTEAPQKAKFRPWNASTCGDWRSFGAVNSSVTVIGVDANPSQIAVASAGDNFSFSFGDKTSSAIVKNIRKVDTKSTTWTPDESVWDISLEVDGHRRSATVCSYRMGGAGNTVIDGASLCIFIT